MALVWTYPNGGGFDRLSACFRSISYGIQPEPWTVEVGLAPSDQGTSLVGEALASMSSDDLEPSGSIVIIAVTIEADGSASIEQVAEAPVDPVGVIC